MPDDLRRGKSYFYPRPPRGGRRFSCQPKGAKPDISIHALREEGDLQAKDVEHDSRLFLSTPSARRATLLIITGLPVYFHFYPRPPRGGRPYTPQLHGQGIFISIHALREEGDGAARKNPPSGGLFLSTPSARRATTMTYHLHMTEKISIHALREEGDGAA